VTAVRVLRPAALAGLEGHAVVEASAGTGKTYILEHLVVDLLLRREVELEQILVVTFTEKATAELVQRVRAKITQLKELGPEHPLALVGAAAPPEHCWVIDESARRRLRAALLAFDRASITTIHGFCQRLLIEHAFLHQRLFDEELVDEADAFHAAFVETLRRDVAPDRAVAPYLSAWLGSGKSLDRLERRLLLPCHRLPPGAIRRPAPLDETALMVALRAIPEVEDGDALLTTELKRKGVHASSAKAAVKRLSLLSALARLDAATPLDPPRALAALESLCDDGEELLPKLAGWLAGVPADGSRAAKVAVAVRALAAAVVPLDAELAHRILPRLQARLESDKRTGGLYDFQDMLGLVARALEGEGTRAQALLATLRGRYRHALIDEFQDTDEVQWSIFRRVFLDGGAGHTLTVIGDPKQAIYSFRGADVHTYLRARAEIVGRGGGQVYLTDNFRSSPALIAAYNAILDQQAAAPFFRAAGGIRYDRPVTCGRPTLALIDHDGAEVPPVVVLDVTTSAPSLYTWQVKQALLGRIVGEMAGLLGRLAVRGVDRPLGPRDVYVVTRTTRESREVGDALRAARIPYAFFKQERLFDTVEAREVLDLLRAIADPDEPTARARAYITAFFGLTLPELTACEDLPSGHPLARLLTHWKALGDAGQFEQLFASIIADSGIVCRELFAGAGARGGERRLTNYLHLLEILQHEAAVRRATLRELAQTLAGYISGAHRPPGQQSDIQRLETDADAVQIMTIHHAKGLEAPVVFLYGGFWPGPRADVRLFHDDEARPIARVGRPPAEEEARLNDEHEDEERRVLYVALTRACARLYLPHYPAVFKQLRGSYKLINQRLDELLGGFTPPEIRCLFVPIPVPCPAPPAPPPVLPDELLAAWTPPPALLAPDEGEQALLQLGQARAGFVVTSYSAVKRRQGLEPAPGDPLPGAVDAEEEAAPPGDAAVPPDELPRGRRSGSFLHECLEEVALDDLRERPPLDRWSARPEVGALFERLRRRHDQELAHLPHAMRLVHTALTAPVRLGPAMIDGLAAAARSVREMEFLYPIPEAAQLPGEWRIERGVVKGFVDLLFEHQGRAYVCDWKGDWLPGWEAAAVAAHSERHYQTQVRLYTLATLRFLGITDQRAHDDRFGGVVYGYLRGMRQDDPAAGVHFQRPAWDEVQQWQRDMLGNGFWRLP
jgi:exodeoxyribonuclease V beta subunit